MPNTIRFLLRWQLLPFVCGCAGALFAAVGLLLHPRLALGWVVLAGGLATAGRAWHRAARLGGAR